MAPTSNQRKAAEELKAEGNALFAKGRYLPAAERYTEAICLVPRDAEFTSLLYVNRALCHRKAGGRWAQVVQDASTALSLDGSLMKAHYLMGVANRELAQLPAAIGSLTKALEAAREKGDSIKDEIWRELAKAKYAQWQQQSELRTTATAALKAQLDSLLSSSRGGVAQQEPFSSRLAQAAAAGGSGSNSQGPADTPEQLLQHAWEALFERAAHLDVRTEVPSHLLCPLTMEVFREPVITPSGCSYERSALLEHLAKVGSWDPISRAPMTQSDVTLNVGLRNAVQFYLDSHPWAWAECV